MSHSHSHEHSPSHSHTGGSSRLLLIGMAMTLLFAGVEAVGGWLSGSLALLGDAGHMFSDSAALAIALIAARMMQRPPSQRLSYGHGRVEVVAAITNSVFMIVIVIGIVTEAFTRISQLGPVDAVTVMLIGTAGLIVNIIVAFVLSKDRHSLNTRAALLHVMGDLLGSVAAIISGIVIYFWGWLLIDPIVSVLICILIIVSSVRLLKEAIHIIMEGVPRHIDLQQVGEAMAAADARIKSVHDLHIWTLSSGHIALSAHIVLSDMGHWPEVLKSEQTILEQEYDITHITLQPEQLLDEVIVPIDNLTG